MELIEFVVVLVLAFTVYLGVKFTNFKARLMNEFGRRGVPFELADDIYFKQGDRINNLHHAGMPVDQIVDKLMGTSPTMTGNANMDMLEGGQQQDADASLEKTKRKQAIIRIVVRALSAQRGLIVRADGGLPDNALDHWSIGYVGGAADAALQRNGFKPDAEGLALMILIFKQIFGERLGASIFGDFVALQSEGNKTVQEGMNLGGQEMFAWMADRNKTPAGWMAHVRALEKLQKLSVNKRGQ